MSADADRLAAIRAREDVDRRERLRRAAEDGERLYQVRMHAPDGPKVRDDHRIDGILTLDLTDALGFVDSLLDRLAAAEASLETARQALAQIVDRHLRACGVHEAPLPDDVALAELHTIARDALAATAPQEHGGSSKEFRAPREPDPWPVIEWLAENMPQALELCPYKVAASQESER